MLVKIEAQLKALANERNSIKASVTRFKKFFEESKHSKTLMEIKKRYDAILYIIYNKYVHAQGSIREIVTGTELESSHAAHRDKFENAYFNIMIAVEDFLKNICEQRKKFSSLVVPPVITQQ